MATKTLSFRCHCSSLTATLEVPTSSFPLTVTNCHCYTSRSVSGNMCTSNIVTTSLLPAPAIPLSNPSLKGYSCSDTVTRYFCSKCGAHALSIADEGGGVETRKIALGILEGNVENDTFEWDGHMWLCDTFDGGVADKWTSHPGNGGRGGRDMKRWWTWAGDEGVKFPYQRQAQLPESRSALPSDEKMEGRDKLRARCRCGGVDFYISRPPPPRATDTVSSSSDQEEEQKKQKIWVRENGTKWLTQACVCSDCRHSSGYPVVFWTFITSPSASTPDVLTLPDNTPVPSSLLFGTLQRYDSSPGVERYFCGTCGAKVFYRQINQDLGFMDVATGLLAREGEESRREDWLHWGKELCFPDSGEYGALVEALKKGFEADL